MLGDRLREARKKSKLTQEALANLIGVKRSVISKYESGAIEPSITQLEKIASALDVSSAYLLGNEIELIPGRLNLRFSVVPGSAGNDNLQFDILSADEESEQAGIQMLNEIFARAGLGTPDYIPAPYARLRDAFDALNAEGQQVAIERIEELAEHPKYQRIQVE